jgi:hypothetical protein
MINLNSKDLNDLKRAVNLLENKSFIIRLTNLIGKPVEAGFRYLPSVVHKAAKMAIYSAYNLAAVTMDERDISRKSSDMMHKIFTTTSGIAGGFIGLPAIPIELPITTVLMLRSIADIARKEGENIRDVRTRLACIEVFALGGREAGEAGEVIYYAVRRGLAQAVSEAAEYIAAKGVADETAPALVRLITQIASRFEIVVSEKVAAEALPIIGAIGGGLINLAFTNHFQDMAKGHFIIRRLERRYGEAAIHQAYKEVLRGKC